MYLYICISIEKHREASLSFAKEKTPWKKREKFLL